MGTFQTVAQTKDISEGMSMSVKVGTERVALFNVAGTYYAIGDSCSHRGGPLSEGELDETTVTCPWHGATFDVRTGKNLGAPAPSAVASFKVRVEGNAIQIEVP